VKEIPRLAAKETLRVAGLMSGTSANGVDAAVVDIGPVGLRLLAFDTFPYPSRLRQAVLDCSRPETARLDDICHLNFALGELFALALIRLVKRNGIYLPSIDLVGSHGQTIYHMPAGRRYGVRKIRSTLQIAEPSVITERTGITTVADFRPRDMAAGGEGAPLVPYADYVMFAHPKVNRAVQNIGGIANVTYLPAGRGTDAIVAFDTGPGNMVIDCLAAKLSGGRSRLDRDGAMAGQGEVDDPLLKRLMAHDFLRRRPPKSTGREDFGQDFCDNLYIEVHRKGMEAQNLLATATAFTAASIAEAYANFLPGPVDEVILCGGGARNVTLVKMLEQQLHVPSIKTTDEFGISVEAKEAVSFALLAAATIRSIPNNIPSATGAERAVILGKVIPA
jgi:anhydro-N-acetylmuramic acid kinase